MHQIVAITGHGSLAEVARDTRATEQVVLARSAMSRLRRNAEPVFESVKPAENWRKITIFKIGGGPDATR